MDFFERKTKKKLIEFCKNNKISGYSKLNKKSLINFIKKKLIVKNEEETIVKNEEDENILNNLLNDIIVKEMIILFFEMNIKDKDIEIENNKSHCGKYGHWLESKFKIKANSKNEPDLCGYEIKKSSSKISFGKPFNFEYFIENIKNKNIIFDSGMYEGNSRNYSQFRSCNKFWNKLIIEEYS